MLLRACGGYIVVQVPDVVCARAASAELMAPAARRSTHEERDNPAGSLDEEEREDPSGCRTRSPPRRPAADSRVEGGDEPQPDERHQHERQRAAIDA